MAARSFEIQARLRAADGKSWLPVPGPPRHVSAASLDQLCAQLSTALDATVRGVAHFDPGEEEWVAVTSLTDIPDTAKLRLETAVPPHSLHYSADSFTVGQAGAMAPIAHDATGAAVLIAPGSLSFHLQKHDALGWMTADEQTGVLRGTPTKPCKVDAEVIVQAIDSALPPRKFWVCHVTVHAVKPADSRRVSFRPFLFVRGGPGLDIRVRPLLSQFPTVRDCVGRDIHTC
jgi:hypothetical protein